MVDDLVRALKMTDAEIASAVGVSERTVQRWKAGRRITSGNRRKLIDLARRRADRLEVLARSLEAS